MKSNFEFLAKKWPILSNIGEFAEKNLYNDPNTTLLKLRLLAEKITKFMMQYEDFDEVENLSLAKRLKILDRSELLTARVKEIFHTIRIAGNKAVHEGYDSFEEAKISLSLAQKISIWFMAVYGNEPSFKIENIVFKLPEKNDKEAKLERLKKEHETKLRELENNKVKLNKGKSRRERDKIGSSIELTEAETRKIIDEKLVKVGWEADSQNLKWPGTLPEKGKNKAIAEWPVGGKWADYALFTGEKFVGIIEAKRKSIDVISVLEEAKSYSRKAELKKDEVFAGGPWGAYKVPFLFATNGRPYYREFETKSGICFIDVREKTNHPVPLRNWYSPADIENLLKQDIEASNTRLKEESFDYLESADGLSLRYYQVQAIKEIEKEIMRDRRKLLLAMATGTGKTRTAIGLIYRFIKTKRFNRILFLVDRNSLGLQAEDKFKENKIEDLRTFDEIYGMKFLKEKFPDDDTKVHIATVQGMVLRILYHNDDDPMFSARQYDCIIVDEAHRGYILDREMDEDEISFRDQSDFISKYRYVIDYFDAVKIGLTATPAVHTCDIFGAPVFNYSYRQAVVDGYLVDHEPPYIIHTRLAETGIKWKAGEPVMVFDPGSDKIDKTICEDEIKIEIEGFNKKVVTENFNRVVIRQLVRYIDPYDEGKTLIFTANDAHADLVVKLLKEEFEEDGLNIADDMIQKITGYIKDQEEAIKRFKNEKEPNIAVTVDLLTTGVDVPEIDKIVFIRCVKSRILYEQMLGRATRLCDEIDKTVFKIYDAVGLYNALKPYTDMKPVVVNPKIGYVDLIRELVHVTEEEHKKQLFEEILTRLQRIRRRIERSNKLERFIEKAGNKKPAEYIKSLQGIDIKKAVRILKKDMALFDFLDRETFASKKVFISEHEDRLRSVERGYGAGNDKPADYLEGFKEFVKENRDRIAALKILCARPKTMTRGDLKELRLVLEENGYTEKYLNTAWKELKNEDILADIISFVRFAALGIPVISHEDRIGRAMEKVRQMEQWDERQLKWINRIEKQLLNENTISVEDFNQEPFKNHGGFERINRILEERLEDIIHTMNENLYRLSA